MPVLCLGEALVDLVCERPVERLEDADSFVPAFGGATANVAVVAAREGAGVELAGGAGDDPWGRWLRERLAAEGVGLRWFELVPGAPTPVAFAWVNGAGEPGFQIYGESLASVAHAIAGRVESAVEGCSALFIGSNTLAGPAEREVTMAARERALGLGCPVVLDPNLRLHRWASPAAAAEASRACVPGALLVRCNRDEARLLTGEEDPSLAAEALVGAGAGSACVTLGAEGALLRGAVRADVPGAPARAVSAIGAGDTLTGVLLAALASGGFDPQAAASALPRAVERAARATERWSAVG